MNIKIRNEAKSSSMHTSYSFGEKIIALNDIKLNSLLIDGSKIQYIPTPTFLAGKWKLSRSCFKIYDGLNQLDVQDEDSAFVLFQNTAIHKKLKKINRLCFKNSIQSLKINTNRVHSLKPSLKHLQQKSERSKQKSTRAKNDQQQIVNKIKLILPKSSNSLANRGNEPHSINLKEKIKVANINTLNLSSKIHIRKMSKYSKIQRRQNLKNQLAKQLESKLTLNTPLPVIDNLEENIGSLKDCPSRQCPLERFISLASLGKQRETQITPADQAKYVSLS